jgi:hypothetical protein
MYVVTEADAAAIREAYETGGELSAAVELRRRFPNPAEQHSDRHREYAQRGIHYEAVLSNHARWVRRIRLQVMSKKQRSRISAEGT